ncbi:MAG TPA: SDR family NAD(P)-dependent oxidoreductase [Pseudomonadales bacterium]|nr:SDR family NAD(P)-dependent oxidoreductase [Pseudomonadales bacterium]
MSLAETRGVIVVTGVSTGIGLAITKRFLASGYEVFGSTRKPADADRLYYELGDHFHRLVFDVRDEAAIRQAAREVRNRLGGRRLMALINNAGIGSNAPLMFQPMDDIATVVDVNLLGPLRVMQAFMPLLGVDPALVGTPGRIVNISSVGALMGAPFMGAYGAAKRGLEAASDSARAELLPYGVDVIVIAPGFFQSAIRDSDPSDFARYDNTAFGPAYRRFAQIFDAGVAQAWPAETLAELVEEVVTVRKPKAHYYVGPPGKFMVWMMSKMSRRMRARATAKQFGMFEPAKAAK